MATRRRTTKKRAPVRRRRSTTTKPVRRRRRSYGGSIKNKMVTLPLAIVVYRMAFKFISDKFSNQLIQIFSMDAKNKKIVDLVFSFGILKMVQIFKTFQKIPHIKEVSEFMFYLSLADYIGKEFDLYSGMTVQPALKPVRQGAGFQGFIPRRSKLMPKQYSGMSVTRNFNNVKMPQAY